jgi:uncharacterized Zn finger protein (UPF0148 family)
MLGCIGFNCNEPEAIADEERQINGNPSQPPTEGDINTNDNELVVDTSHSQQCPFQQCLSDAFTPRRRLIQDERPSDPPPTTIDETPSDEKPPESTNPIVQSAVKKEPPPSPIPTSTSPPVITGITSIDAILNVLSNDNTKTQPPKEEPIDRNAQILQQLGILHLQDKLTRPRQAKETDEHILREAGAARHIPEEEEESYTDDNVNLELDAYRGKLGRRSERELEILKKAGVTMPETRRNIPVSIPADEITLPTVGLTTIQPSESLLTMETQQHRGVSHTYAEKELLRRLKSGWASTGSDCPECGMPILYKLEGGWMECVICGMMETKDEEGIDENLSNFDTTISSGTLNHPRGDDTKRVSSPSGMEIRHYPLEQCASCHNDEVTSKDSTIFGQNTCLSCEKTAIEKCKSDLANEGDDALKKELGKRIFAGWTLLPLNCPNCNLPLISEGTGATSVCLRCG